MGRIRKTDLVLGAVFVIFAVFLVNFADALLHAHANETTFSFASDASTYFAIYEALYADAELMESPALFLVGSPMLFMKLTEGNLLIIQICNLILMLFSIRTALGCINTYSGRRNFILWALVFPYFTFGFLSLNKEVYAMCSAMFFGSYMIRGEKSNLVLALILAAFARYYMLVALIVLLFTVPRTGTPRYKLIAAMLLGISIVAPIAKYIIPQYSSDGLLEDSGTIGIVFAQLIDSYLYAVVYAIKYIMLIPTRAYGFLIGATEDAAGAGVSFLSFVMLIYVCLILIVGRKPSLRTKRLIIAGFAAPVPLLWTEIMHWRYFSFVYFFFLYAVVLHKEEERDVPRPEMLPTAA